MSEKEFKDYHVILKNYAKNLIEVHYLKTGIKSENVCVDDLVSEAILNGCYDIECAKKPMRDFLFNETYVIKGKKQRGKISSGYEKKCNTCNKIKLGCEYTTILDKRHNFIYLTSNCKSCRREKALEYRKNNPLTKEQKQKAKLRYEKFKLRNQKTSLKKRMIKSPF